MLQDLNVDVMRMNTEMLGTQDGITSRSGRIDPQLEIGLRIGAKRTSAKGLAAVWYRRPKSPDLADDGLSDEDLDFARNQSESALHGALALLDRALWVSSPGRIAATSRKPLRLRLAGELATSGEPINQDDVRDQVKVDEPQSN